MNEAATAINHNHDAATPGQVMTERDMLISRGDLRQTRIVSSPSTRAGPDQVLVRIDKFSLISNTVTYGVMDPALGYWNFFPAPEGWGRLPVAGYATVEQSRVAEIEEGERLFGFFPMSTSLVVQPTHITPAGFLDATPTRQPKWPAYSMYTRLRSDPAHDPERENERLVFGFLTGFLVTRMFVKAGWHGASAMIVVSASAKTALTLAHVARASAPEIRRVGLTSSRNAAFLRSTGLYDEVLSYDDIDRLERRRAVVVDFAGNQAVLDTIIATLGDAVAYDCRVGMTHWDKTATNASLPSGSGPAPVWFLSPDHLESVIAELGPETFAQAFAERWLPFVDEIARWVTITEVNGLEAAQAAFAALVGGSARPEVAIVVRPGAAMP